MKLMKAKFLAAAVPFCMLGFSSLLAAARVTLKEGTPVRVRLKADLLSETAQQGKRVDFEVSQPVVVNGVTAIPQGSVAWGAVQEVKAKKFVRFDIEGLRLPNLQQIKLRSVSVKPKNPDKDQIRLETNVGTDVGARRGAEFMAYLAADVEVDVSPPAPAAKAPATPPQAAATPPPQPAVAPPQQAAASPAASVSKPAELVTVQCFSDPLGADILVDGEYMGNTPSILKLTSAKHRLVLNLAGYATVIQTLDLSSSTELRTIQVTLEKTQ
jgi:PEGA domain